MNASIRSIIIVMVFACLFVCPTAHAQRAIFLLRHGERLEYETEDGPLSETGLARAHRLAELLKDAGVTTIFTSEWQRTIQTARPLAEALNIPLTSIGGRAVEQVQATITRVRALGQNDVAVIVGHQNTVLLMLNALASAHDLTFGNSDSLFVINKLREWEKTLWERYKQDSLLIVKKPAGMLGNEQDLTIGNHEHDDLFVIVPTRNGPPTVLRLNY